MQFHRRLHPFRVISFDLDDTLYDNRPVLINAEQSLARFLREHYPQTASISVEGWRQLRDEIARGDPLLANNMTQLRATTLQQGLQRAGLDERAAKAGRDAAMHHFLQVRNQIEVPHATLQLLARCAKKYPVIAISNGNADIHQIGLSDYFSGAWSPDEKLQGKPTADMFRAAQQQFGFAPRELLHIGDHPVSDIQGASRFGAQSVWLNEAGIPHAALTWLPTATIYQLSDLEALLGLQDAG